MRHDGPACNRSGAGKGSIAIFQIIKFVTREMVLYISSSHLDLTKLFLR